MKNSEKGAVICGVVNVIFPFLVVMVHNGVFGTAENPWKFFWLGIFLAVGPLVTSLAGVIWTGILWIKKHQKAAAVGGILSAFGFVLQFVFRFVLKL